MMNQQRKINKQNQVARKPVSKETGEKLQRYLNKIHTAKIQVDLLEKEIQDLKEKNSRRIEWVQEEIGVYTEMYKTLLKQESEQLFSPYDYIGQKLTKKDSRKLKPFTNAYKMIIALRYLYTQTNVFKELAEKDEIMEMEKDEIIRHHELSCLEKKEFINKPMLLNKLNFEIEFLIRSLSKDIKEALDYGLNEDSMEIETSIPVYGHFKAAYNTCRNQSGWKNYVLQISDGDIGKLMGTNHKSFRKIRKEIANEHAVREIKRLTGLKVCTLDSKTFEKIVVPDEINRLAGKYIEVIDKNKELSFVDVDELGHSLDLIHLEEIGAKDLEKREELETDEEEEDKEWWFYKKKNCKPSKTNSLDESSKLIGKRKSKNL